jgi:hypothetical protein
MQALRPEEDLFENQPKLGYVQDSHNYTSFLGCCGQWGLSGLSHLDSTPAA